MGLLARVFEACSRVLLAGRRHGDVTLLMRELLLKEGFPSFLNPCCEGKVFIFGAHNIALDFPFLLKEVMP